MFEMYITSQQMVVSPALPRLASPHIAFPSFPFPSFSRAFLKSRWTAVTLHQDRHDVFHPVSAA